MRVNRSLVDATPDLAVFASAFSAIIWAAILALPGESLALDSFHYMGMFGGDRIWSVAFLAVGILQLWRIVGRTQTESFRFAFLSDLCVGFFAAVLWTFVTGLCLFNSWPPSPYAGSTAVLAAGVWWDFLHYNPQHLRKPKEVVESAPEIPVTTKRVASK